jgi:transcriptional regulator with XRE-family HTH domain
MSSTTLNEHNRTRAKILGVLIRDARLHAGRSLEECARVIHLPPQEFKQAEEGEYVLSLTHLEVLAMYLKVPLNHFWGDKVLGNYHRTDYGEVLKSRNRAIGQLLHQAREKTGRTVQAVAKEIGVPPSKVTAYEEGSEAVPLFHLDRMARFLGHSLNFFIDDNSGALGKHEAEQRMKQKLDNLPPEVRAFVAEPINLSYLEIAMKLSNMNVKELRSVAENILNITF